MRITRVTVENYAGAAAVAVECSAPTQLFCGLNHQGKSSTRDAIAMAMFGDLGRYSTLKEAPKLIHGAAGSASVEVRTADGSVYGATLTRSGKRSWTHKDQPIAPALAYVFDGQRFAQLDDTGRRAFLLGLLGIKMDPDSIVGRLAAVKCDAAKIDKLKPFLRSGLAAAAEEAATQATQAKGAWRGITGENYGSTKALDWQAPKPSFAPEALAATLESMARLDADIATAQQALGAMDADVRRLTEARGKREALLAEAASLARRKDKLAADEDGLKKAQEALDSATNRAGSALRTGLVHDLARSVSALVHLGDVGRDSVVGEDAWAAMDAYEDVYGSLASDGSGDSVARAQLPNLTDARNLMASAVRNSMRDISNSQAAENTILALDKEIAELAPKCDTAASDTARARLKELQAERAALAAAAEKARAAKTASEAADRNTATARKHHADVEAWGALAAALGPSGIQAQILAEALGPINGRLAQSAVDAEWPAVVIGPDMGIIVGGREYRALAASEQYMADAMVAEAVSFLSGLKLLVLDGFDVLMDQRRADLFAWVDVLAENGEIDSALLFGSLKSKPQDMGEFTDVHWIEGGRCVELVLEAC